MAIDGGAPALVRLHDAGPFIDPAIRDGQIGYQRVARVVDPQGYAGMTVVGRILDFISARAADMFKLVGNAVSISTAALDLEPAQVRQFVGVGKGAGTFANGLDALNLPSNATSLFYDPSLPNFTKTVDGVAKAYKFGKGMNFWKPASFDVHMQTAQNLAGIVTCSDLAFKDIDALKRPAPGEGAPAYRQEAYQSKWTGKLISLTKNVARVAINVLAAAGALWGIAVWAPVMVGLATVGTVGSIASFFFKQNAEIIEANGRIAELQEHIVA